MTRPKMKPCPKCGTDAYIAVYTYESGWSRVECDRCHGIFSCESTKAKAVKKHNEAAIAGAEMSNPTCGGQQRRLHR